MKYEYSFFIYPDETRQWDAAIWLIFSSPRRFGGIDFTQEEFERFRSGLSHHGFTLREIERVPYHKPETIL